jgi:hypothetical protein
MIGIRFSKIFATAAIAEIGQWNFSGRSRKFYFREMILAFDKIIAKCTIVHK